MSGQPIKRSSILRLGRLVVVFATTVAASGFAPGQPGVGAPQGVDDSATICQRIDAYRKAWNAHDPCTLAAFFKEDADFVMGNLPAVRGRQEIRRWWQDYFERQEPERRLTLDVTPVRFVGADAAIVNVATTTGGRNNEGQELPARVFRGTWLWHRQNDDWLIAAMLGMPDERDRIVLNASVHAKETPRPQIRAFVAAYEDEFNTHDPSAVTTFYTDDADIVVRNSPVIHGRQAILDWWRTYFSKPRLHPLARSSRHETMVATLIVNEIRMMAPDVALVNITATGARPRADSEAAPARYARVTWVLVREEGEWLIAAHRALPSEEDRILRESDR